SHNDCARLWVRKRCARARWSSARGRRRSRQRIMPLTGRYASVVARWRWRRKPARFSIVAWAMSCETLRAPVSLCEQCRRPAACPAAVYPAVASGLGVVRRFRRKAVPRGLEIKCSFRGEPSPLEQIAERLMFRRLFGSLPIVACLGFAAPALSQDWLGVHLETQREENRLRHQQERQAGASKAPNTGERYEPPIAGKARH